MSKQITITFPAAENLTYSATVYADRRVELCDEESRVIGEGRWDGASLVDCPVDLGDDVYEQLDELLGEALKGQQFIDQIRLTWTEDADGDQWCWPTTEDEIAACRQLVRRGQAVESTGECEGCEQHAPGTKVPVFCKI